MQFCSNCALYQKCYYRGIINPCSDWRANHHIRLLRLKAEEMRGLQMTFDEHRFVESCETLISFSPKQEAWLMSVYNRLMYERM